MLYNKSHMEENNNTDLKPEAEVTEQEEQKGTKASPFVLAVIVATAVIVMAAAALYMNWF